MLKNRKKNFVLAFIIGLTLDCKCIKYYKKVGIINELSLITDSNKKTQMLRRSESREDILKLKVDLLFRKCFMKNNKNLDISRLNLRDDIIDYIAKSPMLDQVEYLNLNYNECTKNGFLHLASSSYNKNIKTLEMRFNNINKLDSDRKGMSYSAIQDRTMCFPKLEKLWLQGNNIDKNFFEVILSIKKQNIKTMCFYGNECNSTIKKMLRPNHMESLAIKKNNFKQQKIYKQKILKQENFIEYIISKLKKIQKRKKYNLKDLNSLLNNITKEQYKILKKDIDVLLTYYQ